MVTTALPEEGTYRARLERAIRRRDVAAWIQHVLLGVVILVNPSIGVQTILGRGSVLQAVLGGFFILGGLIGAAVRIRGLYRAEKVALTFTRVGILMYIVVLLFATQVGYPSGTGLVIAALLLTYLDKQRLEGKIFEHTARVEDHDR